MLLLLKPPDFTSFNISVKKWKNNSTHCGKKLPHVHNDSYSWIMIGCEDSEGMKSPWATHRLPKKCLEEKNGGSFNLDNVCDKKYHRKIYFCFIFVMLLCFNVKIVFGKTKFFQRNFFGMRWKYLQILIICSKAMSISRKWTNERLKKIK